VPGQRHLCRRRRAQRPVHSDIQLNAELAKLAGWKSITKRKEPLPDADDWKDKAGKLSELIR
jgi:hypothetical protein